MARVVPCEVYRYPDSTSNLASALAVHAYDSMEQALRCIEATNVNAGTQLCAGPSELHYCAVDDAGKVLEGSVRRDRHETERWLASRPEPSE